MELVGNTSHPKKVFFQALPENGGGGEAPAGITRYQNTKCPNLKNIAKGTTDPRVEFISQVLAPVLVKFQFQDLDIALPSKSQPNISIL